MQGIYVDKNKVNLQVEVTVLEEWAKAEDVTAVETPLSFCEDTISKN